MTHLRLSAEAEEEIFRDRAGLRRSDRIGKLILLGLFGVLIPVVVLTIWLLS